MTARHSALWIRAVGVLWCSLVLGVGPAHADSVAYVPTAIGAYRGAYLVDWKAGNWARVVGVSGAGIGAFTDDGTQRVVTLGAALSYISSSSDLDCFGNQYTQRVDTRQFVFRKVAGSVVNGRTEVVEIGTITALDGCSAGRILPFGSLTEPGSAMQHRALSAREPMTDVLPGFTIAGFAEGPGGDIFDPIGAYDPRGTDVVTLETPTSLRFQRTGTVVPATLNAEQWLMLQMPGFERGYTRIAFDKASGAEIWLAANFRDGVPVQVDSAMMIKPVPGFSFGSGARSSRMWESAVTLGTDFPVFFYLYRDRTGERVDKDLTTGDESRDPTTWRFAGSDIVQTYFDGTRRRTWTPLARNGNYMFVFENESRKYPGQPRILYIPNRVNFYVDRGPALRP